MRDARLWLDDLRPAPSGWLWVKTAWEAIDALQRGGVAEVSLDHDLGEPAAGTGYDVAEWIEVEAYHGRVARLRWRVHSANPIGAERMTRALDKADIYWGIAEEDGAPPGAQERR